MKFSVNFPNLANKWIITRSLLFIHPFSAKATTTTGTVSIENTPEYGAQRECVQSALWSGRNVAGEWNIVDWLGCTNHLDSCFCRADLASSASSLLTSGINSFCSSDATDVASGIAVYNSYCSRTGPATVDTAVTTTGSDSTTATITATQTVFSSGTTTTTPQILSSTTNSGASLIPPSLSTSTTPSLTSSIALETSSGRSDGLSSSDRISLGLGLSFGLLATFFSAWMIWLMRRPAGPEVEEEQALPP